MSVDFGSHRLVLIASCLLLTTNAATGLGAENAGFSVEVVDDVMYLLSYNRKDRDNSDDLVCEAVREYKDWIHVLRDGKPPEQGVFNVNGEPVIPQLVVVKGPKPEQGSLRQGFGVHFNGKSFGVVNGIPGTYTLRASVGTWSESFKIEARQLPVWERMQTRDLLVKLGYPDKKEKFLVSGEDWAALQGRSPSHYG